MATRVDSAHSALLEELEGLLPEGQLVARRVLVLQLADCKSEPLDKLLLNGLLVVVED